ncbi:unnamed protein product [Penicillium salamii]|uniref:Aminoglycoside phosphotransferase domain-containing protein n=1 Tax=Penicillium salamii TaxID=1612424 RepID=A0A9W4JKB5_9EURO|nr:unnamed protein product [Penicillium salamii]CAG8140318.1 unnamed protein product [Penicillium salamii]CAG8157238.1 unnamed protein product [Penicillium salamii]CAG8159411.1 unnamed protein product [Penicillium salamii]CAG8259261.1 unnamed protein product [Penicillium salamii]
MVMSEAERTMLDNFKPSQLLPAPEGTVLSESWDRKVVRISEDRIVKLGFSLNPSEAANLRFVKANTTIPVPMPYDFIWHNDKLISIEMDYMPGKPLDKVWDSMDSTQRLSIANQLQGYISQLRALKGDYIGAAERGKAIYGCRISTKCGPFDSEKAYNEWRLADVYDDVRKTVKPAISFALPNDHEIVFTHNDISPRNIHVDESGNITAIVDWEASGFYPEYQEYVRSLDQLDDPDGWHDYHSIIFKDKYERDYIFSSFVKDWTRHE